MIPLLLISHSKPSLKRFLEKKNQEEKNIIIPITPQTTGYSIDQVREIAREVKIGQPMKRIYVLEDFEHSSPEAQNSFLKLLEEPPSQVEFILTVSNPYSLLPTIISRTKIILLDKRRNIIIDPSISKALTEYVTKKNRRTVNFSLFTASKKEEALILLIQMCLFFRERFTLDPISTHIEKEILTVYRLVQNNNSNPQLALDHLLIFISKKYSMK